MPITVRQGLPSGGKQVLPAEKGAFRALFRRDFGVSPYRYVTLRRLDIARRHFQDGGSLADAAFNAGFADQSHMTRQFRRAFGLTPGAWRNLAN